MYKLTVSLLSLFLVVAANAQESGNKIISRFEFVAGPSFSNNTGYLNNYDSKTGYSFGVGYYQKLYKSFSLNVRALHEMKGSVANYPYGAADETGVITEINDKYTTEFNYLTLYLFPTLQLGKNKNLYLGAGGYYSFLRRLSVSTFRTNKETGEFISESTTTDPHYFDPTFDAGVAFQAGYSFNVSSKIQLMLQAFINRGLVDLHNDYPMGSQRNNTFGILLSARIR